MRPIIPDGPWQNYIGDVEQCQYEDIEGTEMFEASLSSRIDHPDTHVGQGDVWFRVEDKGFAGLWEPSNGSKLRFAPVYVLPDHRGRGIGRALVVKRFRYGLDRPDIEKMDTYAHNPDFFHKIGFEWQEFYEQKGTHHLVFEQDYR